MILYAVYYAQGFGCQINPIAIKPHFLENRVTWNDTSDRMVNLKVRRVQGLLTPETANVTVDWQQCPKTLDLWIETEQGNKKIALTLMTLKIYNEKVRHQTAGQPQFTTDQELQSYYQTTAFGSYNIPNESLPRN